MGIFKWDEIQGSPATAEALKYGRRLSDKILIAFHHACDARDIRIAEELLSTLDSLLKRPAFIEDKDRRKAGELLIDANYRLWDLKRSLPEAAAPETLGSTRLVADAEHV